MIYEYFLSLKRFFELNFMFWKMNQDLNFSCGIQTKVKCWPLIKTFLCLQQPKIPKFWFSWLSSVSKNQPTLFHFRNISIWASLSLMTFSITMNLKYFIFKKCAQLWSDLMTILVKNWSKIRLQPFGCHIDATRW